MKEQGKTKSQLIKELMALRTHIAQLEGAEAARIRAEEALRINKERLALALESSLIGLWDYDVPSGKIYYNPYYYIMLGQTPTEAPLDVRIWISLIHPDDRDRVVATSTEHLEGKNDFHTVDYRMQSESGAWCWISSRGKVVKRDTEGNPIRMVGTCTDITGRKEAEARIQQLNNQLEQHVLELEASNKELETFSYTVSHDLRTPLLGIEGFSRILMERYSSSLDAKGQHYLSLVHGTARHMQELIRDFLSFFRLGRKDIEYSVVALGPIVQEVYDELCAIYTDRSLQLNLKGLPDAYGDAAMLRQVLFNLLENSVKFSNSEPVTAIEVGGWTEQGTNVYYVRDNGIGFPMEQADKIFKIFERLHSSDEFEGTGIGLAIVQRIIQRHGGKVWAEGRPREGAVFYFSIVRKTQAPDSAEPGLTA
jgi:PAS domain S-box-containing protein